MMSGHARRASPVQAQEHQQASGGDRLPMVQCTATTAAPCADASWCSAAVLWQWCGGGMREGVAGCCGSGVCQDLGLLYR
jgi:hypothetical protein